MPKISYAQLIDVSPERFLEACSVDELQETLLLLNGARFMNKIREAEEMSNVEEEPIDPRQIQFPWWNDVKQIK